MDHELSPKVRHVFKSLPMPPTLRTFTYQQIEKSPSLSMPIQPRTPFISRSRKCPSLSMSPVPKSLIHQQIEESPSLSMPIQPRGAHSSAVAKISIFINVSRPQVAPPSANRKNFHLHQCLSSPGAHSSACRENLHPYQYLGLTATHHQGYKQPAFLKTGADLKRGAHS